MDVGSYAAWAAVVIATGSLIYSFVSNRAGRFRQLEEKVEEKASKDWLLEVSGKVDRVDNAKADRESVGIVAGKLDVVEDRVTRVETDFKHLPDKNTTHRLEIALGEMRAEMAQLSERMKPLGHIADRIQEAMIEKVIG